MLREFSRFSTVGIVAAGVDFLAFNVVLMIVSGLEVFAPAAIAKFSAASLATLFSFALYDRWVFSRESVGQKALTKVIRFSAVVLGLIVGSSGLVVLFVAFFPSASSLALNLANFIVVGLSALAKFYLLRNFVFDTVARLGRDLSGSRGRE